MDGVMNRTDRTDRTGTNWHVSSRHRRIQRKYESRKQEKLNAESPLESRLQQASAEECRGVLSDLSNLSDLSDKSD